MATANAVLPEH